MNDYRTDKRLLSVLSSREDRFPHFYVENQIVLEGSIEAFKIRNAGYLGKLLQKKHSDVLKQKGH